MTFLNDDWKDWLDEDKVKNIVERICYLKNQRYRHGLEYYPAWIRQERLSEEKESYNIVTQCFDVKHKTGRAEARIGMRPEKIENFRTHYPDYGGITPQRVSGLKKFFKEYPTARLDEKFDFFLLEDGNIIVDCGINLSMGLTQNGRAGCRLKCTIDIFLCEYEKLIELTSQQRGEGGNPKVWSDWRIKFEKYVENCEYVEMGMTWGKGYEIITIDDDESPL
jgi:hypothetical protein